MTSRRRIVTLILLHALLTQAITYAMRPTLAYAVLDVGGGTGRLGVIVAAFAAPALLLALPTGHWVDRLGARSALVAGAGLFVVAAVTALLAESSFAVLLVGACALGAGHTFSVVADQSLLSRQLGSNLERGFGWYGFAAALGQAVGPGLLTVIGGGRTLPPVDAIFTVCASAAVLLMLVSAAMSSPGRIPDRSEALPRASATLLRVAGMPRALVTGGLVIAAVDLFYGFIPAVGYSAGCSAQMIGLVLMSRAVATMISRVSVSVILPRVGHQRLLVVAVAVSGVSLGLMAIPVHAGWLIALAFVFGFSNGACQPMTMSWVSSLAPHQRQGLAVSLRVTGNRLSQTVIPLSLGSLATVLGPGAVLAATGVLLGGAAWSAIAIVSSPGALRHPAP